MHAREMLEEMNPMSNERRPPSATRFPVGGLAASAAAAVSAIVLAHGHITVDTVGGMPGDRTLVRVGYLPAESMYRAAEEGTLMNGTAPWRMRLLTAVSVPNQFQGWRTATDATLTSDFFYSTGRLEGGDFRFELARLERLDGTPSDAQVGWAVVGAGGALTNVARTGGAMREDRSFDVGTGNHVHGQYVFGDLPGVYRLTLVAWDANGVYEDSDPVTIEIQVGALPAGDLNGDGSVTGADLGLLLGQWGGG